MKMQRIDYDKLKLDVLDNNGEITAQVVRRSQGVDVYTSKHCLIRLKIRGFIEKTNRKQETSANPSFIHVITPKGREADWSTIERRSRAEPKTPTTLLNVFEFYRDIKRPAPIAECCKTLKTSRERAETLTYQLVARGCLEQLETGYFVYTGVWLYDRV